VRLFLKNFLIKIFLGVFLIDDKLNNIITSIDRHHTRMNLIKSLTSTLHSFSEDDAAFMSDCYCELIYKQYKEELFKII